MTFPSHVLELGHSPHPQHAWRWSYCYAFDMIKDVPARETAILTWSERWLLPTRPELLPEPLEKRVCRFASGDAIYFLERNE